MSFRGRSLQLLTAAALAYALVCASTAVAFEVHNPIEPPFATPGSIGDLAVDITSGDIYATHNPDYPSESNVEVYGPGGGSPVGGSPSSITGTSSFEGTFPPAGMNGVAIDNTCIRAGLGGSECDSLDPSSGDIYISVAYILYKYRLNAAHEYEYLCAFRFFGGSGNRCLPTGGQESEVEGDPEAAKVTGIRLARENVALDSAGDVYVLGRTLGAGEEAIIEFNPAGESVRRFKLPELDGPENEFTDLAVGSNGTLYVYSYPLEEVAELKRSSPTGPVEGEPVVLSSTERAGGIAFDQISGQLFVDLGSSVEALNEAHEVVSRFGTGVIENGGAITIDEGTGPSSGDVYVVNESQKVIDVFGPGLPATAPAVDTPPPTLSDVTRTSALLSGAIATGNATTSWQLEYVADDEYQPTAADPYATGGSTPVSQLAPAGTATSIGPLALTGLKAGTTYDYRLRATNALATTYGPNHTFSTLPGTPPVVTTGSASAVTQTSAALAGTVDTRELQTSYEFEVGTDTSYAGAKLFGDAGAAGVETVSASLQFLIPGTTYHYRLVATNEDGTTYGQDMTFTTPAVEASIAQPPTTIFVPNPSGAFPSTTGAITKGLPTKKHKTKTKGKAKPKQRHAGYRRKRRKT